MVKMKAVYLIISLFVAAQTSNVSAQMNYKLRNTENAHVTIQPAPQQAVPNGYYVVSEPQHPLAPTTRKPKGAIDSIIWRNKVRCGSDMSVNSYAHQEDGVWFG